MKGLNIVFLLVAVMVSSQSRAQEEPKVEEVLVKLIRDDNVTDESPANNAYEVEVTIKNPQMASKVVLTVENVESGQVIKTQPVNLLSQNGQMFYVVNEQEYSMTNNKATVKIEIGQLEFDQLTVGYQLYDLQNKELNK